jgi:Ni,Fe-hydrogenase III large subunit
LDEIKHSLKLISKAGVIEAPSTIATNPISASGEAMIETPRGMARLKLMLEKGQIISAQLDTPSTCHRNLIKPLTDQHALTDALVAIGSLDLSPWEIES